MYEAERKKVDKAVEYLNQIAVQKPGGIHVEEIGEHGIVLSYDEDSRYSWSQARVNKLFVFNKEGEIESMQIFKK